MEYSHLEDVLSLMSGKGRADGGVGLRVGARGEEMRNAQHVNQHLLLSSHSPIVLLMQ